MNSGFDILKNTYFFKDLNDEELDIILSACTQSVFHPREIIFEEGSRADCLYIILEGEVEVWKDYRDTEKDMLAIHGKGHLFGEMALIDELPRSATVLTRDKTKVLAMNRGDFHRILKERTSIALTIMKSVSNMVRKSNQKYVEKLRSRNRALEMAYNELKNTQEELLISERLSTLGKFSSLILHDIRNPISVVRGYAEMIRLHSDSEDKVLGSAAKIIDEADRLNRLASDLLDFSHGGVRLNLEIVNLKDFIEGFATSIHDRFRLRRIVIETKVDFTGPVLCDRERMSRVLFNLADNSRKAMSDGGEFKIRVYEDNDETGWYIIEVADTGIGMDSEVQKKIFEPFFTAPGNGGTGLGMSIVESIVKAHEGRLSLASEKNKGTVFHIILPKLS